MDRKSLIILLVSFLALLAWYPITNTLFPPKPAPKTNAVTRATNQISPTNRSVPELSAASTNTPAVSSPHTNLPPREERTTTLETPDARYVFSSIGGGLKLIELKRFPAAVDCSAK